MACMLVRLLSRLAREWPAIGEGQGTSWFLAMATLYSVMVSLAVAVPIVTCYALANYSRAVDTVTGAVSNKLFRTQDSPLDTST